MPRYQVYITTTTVHDAIISAPSERQAFAIAYAADLDTGWDSGELTREVEVEELDADETLTDATEDAA